MSEPALPQSSDSLRHSRPLRYAQSVSFDGPFQLESGGQLSSVTVAYETYGQLNPSRDNAILVGHAISGDSHVARHNAEDDPGWWDLMVGPGKPIDTDRFFVICPNLLGGCRGTTGPGSMNPATGKPYGPDFPTVTVEDMVELQRKLIDHLKISKLLAVVGGSIGGHQVLTWAIRFPERLAAAVLLASSSRLTSQALAFDVVGRNDRSDWVLTSCARGMCRMMCISFRLLRIGRLMMWLIWRTRRRLSFRRLILFWAIILPPCRENIC